jgi:hypothetical protein
MSILEFQAAEGDQQLLRETAVVLELLAFALAIIAQPGTAPLFGRALATMAQHTAANWAAMLITESPVVEGGAQ